MKKYILVLFLFILLIATIGINYYQNNNFKVTEYTLTTDKLNSELRIVQLSDLHNKDWGTQIYDTVKNLNPDIIVLTGDMVDYYKPNMEISLQQISPLTEIAPTYFVTGNHEGFSNWVNEFSRQSWNSGIIVLNDEYEDLDFIDNCVIIGLKDNSLNVPEVDVNKFNILLAHRPDYFDFYAAENMDLVLSGHTHAGQVCLPFLGGFYAPNQGLFPDYLYGEYKQDNSTLIISAGLGNSSFPFRVFNQPEIVVVNIHPMS